MVQGIRCKKHNIEEPCRSCRPNFFKPLTGRKYNEQQSVSSKMLDNNKAIVDDFPNFFEISKFYQINYSCGNCGNYGYVHFLKGSKRHKFLCSKCECEVTP